VASAVDEKLIRQTADALVSLGLADAGYQYLVVDGGFTRQTSVCALMKPKVSLKITLSSSLSCYS
jgi:hypothetical protein